MIFVRCYALSLPKKIDTFLYKHFKGTRFSPVIVSVQQWKKITMMLFKNIKRHQTDLLEIVFVKHYSPNHMLASKDNTR